MAGSRLFKIGTIFSRTNGLIKAGAKSWEDRPIWYDVYEAFPPKIEPNFSQDEPTGEVKNIFYIEDIIRAKFYKEFGSVGLINLSERNTRPTICQLFIEEYLKLKENTELPEEKLWNEVTMLLENRGIRLTKEPLNLQVTNEMKKTPPPLADTFSQAQNDQFELDRGSETYQNEDLSKEEEMTDRKPLEINIDNIFSESKEEK